MSERIRPSPDYEIDGYFHLHYGPGGERVLRPCNKIEDPNLLIGLIDNNFLNPRRLLLRENDRQTIYVTASMGKNTYRLDYPGKSGFIYFNKCRGSTSLVGEMVQELLSGKADRRDHLHCATVGEIGAAGWKVYWAPLQQTGNLLHVRMVTASYRDPTLDDAEALRRAFIKIG